MIYYFVFVYFLLHKWSDMATAKTTDWIIIQNLTRSICLTRNLVEFQSHSDKHYISINPTACLASTVDMSRGQKISLYSTYLYLGLSTVTAHTELNAGQFLFHIAPATSETFITPLDGLFCCSLLTRVRVPCCQPYYQSYCHMKSVFKPVADRTSLQRWNPTTLTSYRRTTVTQLRTVQVIAPNWGTGKQLLTNTKQVCLTASPSLNTNTSIQTLYTHIPATR